MKRRVLAGHELEGGAAACWSLAILIPVASAVAGGFNHLATGYLTAGCVIAGVIVVGGATLLLQREREPPEVRVEPYAGDVEPTTTTVVRVLGGVVAASVISAACSVLILVFILAPAVHPLRLAPLLATASIVQSVWLSAFGVRFHLLACDVAKAQRAAGSVFVSEPLRAGQRGRAYWRLCRCRRTRR